MFTGNGKKCYVVPVDDKHSRWCCTGCGAKMTVAQVENVSQVAKNRLAALKGKSMVESLHVLAGAGTQLLSTGENAVLDSIV